MATGKRTENLELGGGGGRRGDTVMDLHPIWKEVKILLFRLVPQNAGLYSCTDLSLIWLVNHLKGVMACSQLFPHWKWTFKQVFGSQVYTTHLRLVAARFEMMRRVPEGKGRTWFMTKVQLTWSAILSSSCAQSVIISIFSPQFLIRYHER